MSESLNSDQHQQLLFMMLLQQHEQIAMMGLGKIKNPATDAVDRDLKTAKYAIDTLVMLEKFTSGNLPKELNNYLTQILTNLRLNYADEKKKDSAGASKTEEGAKPAGASAIDGGSSKEGAAKSGDNSGNNAGSKAEAGSNADENNKAKSDSASNEEKNSKAKENSKTEAGSKSNKGSKNGGTAKKGNK